MLQKLFKATWHLLVIVGLIGFIPAATVQAQDSAVACEQEYTVQADDWLSRIAEARYGDPLAYPAIVDATNAQGEGFATIDNPNVIEIGWTLCVPSQADAQTMLGETGQMEEAAQAEQNELTAPADEMLMIIRNLSKANAPSTFTISGGEYAGGEQITVDHGERLELDLEPADYRVIWSSPAAETPEGDDISFGRDFTAVPGTVARARIVPEKEQVFFNFNVNQEETPEAQAQQMARPEEQLTPPSDEMLLIINNFSKANATSTFTIAGGEYAGGEQITVDHGEEVVLRLEPADYRVIWSSPAAEDAEGDDISFGRSFTAVPGTVARARITPEKNQVAFRFKVREDQTEEMAETTPADQMTETAESEAGIDREFPYEAPAGQGMLVVGNRSKGNIPSTLTITGGRFAGGEQITVDPGDQVFLPVEPGEFTVQWSAPVDEPEGDEGETVIVSRQIEIVAGETPFWWIVPEEFRAFSQSEGEAPAELKQ